MSPVPDHLAWNLSLVLHQLTKAPFEPIKEASLKHLTFKTVFLLALGSGKHRSEIHAWQNKKHQTPIRLVKGIPVPITQVSFQESAGQRGSRQCGPSGYKVGLDHVEVGLAQKGPLGA